MKYHVNCYRLAKACHEGQLYGDEPYFDYHIRGTVKLAMEPPNYLSLFDPDVRDYYDAKVMRGYVSAIAHIHDLLNQGLSNISKFYELEMPTPVICGASCLSQQKNENYFQYIQRIATYRAPYAAIYRAVKMAELSFDIGHIKRENGLKDKYRLAREIIANSSTLNKPFWKLPENEIYL